MGRRGRASEHCSNILLPIAADSVDFVKSGIAVDRNNIPREPFDRRGHRPDYDARDVRGQTVYQSPKALGELSHTRYNYSS